MAVAELASSPTKEPEHFRTDHLRSRDLAFPDGNASSRFIARATRSTGMVQPICASDKQEARICTVERHGLLLAIRERLGGSFATELVRLWWSDPARDSRAGRTHIRTDTSHRALMAQQFANVLWWTPVNFLGDLACALTLAPPSNPAD